MKRSGPVTLSLAVLALGVAALFALGPASRSSTEYSWAATGATDSAPLLLLREPTSLEFRFECGAGFSAISTARDATGMTVVVDQQGVRAEVLSLEEFEFAIDSASCREIAVTVDETHWSVSVDGRQAGDGFLDRMPSVSILDSEADAPVRSRSIQVTSAETGRSPSALQWVLLAGALPLLAGVVVRVSRQVSSVGTQHSQNLAEGSKRWWRVDRYDVVVLLAMVLWLFVGPVFFDDGWVVARHNAFRESGEFSTVFVTKGGTAPLGLWVDWLTQWWVNSVGSLVLWRLLPFAVGLVLWRLTRSVVGRGIASLWDSAVPVSIAMATFLLGYFAWLQTLRPEPITALFTILSVSSVLSFRRTEHPRHLLAAGLCVAAGATTHPAGLVAAAPLISEWRTIGAWAIRNRFVVAACGMTAMAVFLLLFAFDGDLAARATDVDLVRSSGSHPLSWRDEPERYFWITNPSLPWTTPIRRAHVAAILLVPLAHLLLRRNGQSTDATVASRALLIGICLLAVTPSKWPWHFGALVPLAAAVSAFLGQSIARHRPRTTYAIGLAAGCGLLLTWAWSKSFRWALIDLRTLAWAGDADVQPTTWSALSFWLGIPLVFAATWFIIGTARTRRLEGVSNSIASGMLWSVPVMVLLTLGVTVGTFLADARSTSGWTLFSQNRASLTREHCGLAEGLAVDRVGDRYQIVGFDDLSVQSASTEDHRWSNSIPQGLPGLLSDPDLNVLISPDLMMFFPCAAPLAPSGGVLPVPDIVIIDRPIDGTWLEAFRPANSFAAYERAVDATGELGETVFVYLAGVRLDPQSLERRDFDD